MCSIQIHMLGDVNRHTPKVDLDALDKKLKDLFSDDRIKKCSIGDTLD
jgi:hypothetical protein